MTKEEYRLQLQSPQWDKLRKKILLRDNFSCSKCGIGDCELHVHHTYYINGKKAWQYPMKALVTLCKSCHKKEHKNKDIKDFIRVEKKNNVIIAPYIDEEFKETNPHYKKKVKKIKKKTSSKVGANLEKLRNKRILKRKYRK